MNEHPPMDETSFSGAWQDSTLPDLDSLGFEDSNSFNLDELDFDSMSSFDLRPIDNLDPNLLQSIDAEVPAHFRLPEEMYDVLFQGVQCQYYTPTTEPVYSLTCPSMTSSMEVNAPSMSFFLPPANQDQLAVDNDPQDRLYYDAEQQMIVNAIPSEPVIHRSQSPPQSCEDQATQTPTSLSSTEGKKEKLECVETWCNITRKDKRSLKRHYNSYHPALAKRLGVYEPRKTCQYCPKTFSRKDNLLRHLTNKHSRTSRRRYKHPVN